MNMMMVVVAGQLIYSFVWLGIGLVIFFFVD